MTSPHRATTGVDLCCSLLDTATGRERDVRVVAPGDATLADLIAAVGEPAHDEAVWVNGRAVRRSSQLGAPPLVHGCRILLGGTGPAVTGSEPALSLDVVGGPDAGRSLPLAPGDHVVGRCAPARLRLDDDQLSRRHAVVSVATDAVAVQDLRSTNGSWVVPSGPDGTDAVRVRAAVELPVGSRLRLGRSWLELRAQAGLPARTRSSGGGTIEVNRPPRHRPRTAAMSLTVPTPPADHQRAGVPWVGVAVPLLLSVGAAWFLHQATYLLFGLMSPLVLAGSALVDRRSGRRRRTKDDDRWRQQVAEVSRRARRALAEELAQLRRTTGDPVALERLARLPGGRLWERSGQDDDVLVLSVGTADVPSRRVSWQGLAELPGDGRAPERPDEGVPDAVLRDAPLTVDLVRLRHLGVCGDRAMATRMLRWVLGQLVVWHGPATVRVAVASDHGDEWGWTRWLPHRVEAEPDPDDVIGWVDDLVRRRRQLARDKPWTGEHVVVLVDSARLVAAGRLAQTLGCLQDVGVHVICLADEPASLPAQCGAVVTVGADGGGRLTRDGESTAFAVDGVRAAWADELARSLAPLRDATPAPGSLPPRQSLSDLLPVDSADPGAVARLWRSTLRSTRAVIGVAADGPLEIDLLTDGPHVLVAGTTGSGKSELLRTLVTSLAVVNRPDELVFVLVDYKGGAAFRGCAELVHTAGLVTDLDEQLAARALVSLESELRQRERHLQAAGCRDLTTYQARRDSDPTLPALPRLVLVVDEFRVLATELPDFLDGVVRLAATGRSLGVHVVLATQRPAGVVTADIKANMNLRICLRVRDRTDSDDVLDAVDAAAISPETPGRALLRRGDDTLVEVQVAQVGEPDRPPEALLVRDWPQTAAIPETSETPEPMSLVTHEDDESGLTRTAAACRAAATSLDIPAPRPVWQPPLPDDLTLEQLEQRPRDDDDSSDDDSGDDDNGDHDNEPVPLALLDVPDAQRQTVWGWHPVDDGHLAISGGARTGRTNALLALASGLARRWSPEQLHLHVVTVGRSPLAALDRLPHTGTVVSLDQPHRVARLVERLTTEVAARRRSGDAGRTTPAGEVLVIDDWEAVTERLADVDHGRPADALLSLLRDGAAMGMRAVLAGGRGVLLSRVAAVVANRLLLRPNDPTDLLLAGVPPAAVPLRQPPGRALRPGDGAQLQIARAPRVDDVLRDVAGRWPSWAQLPPERRAPRLHPLPDRVDASSLQLQLQGHVATWALVGCGEDGRGEDGSDAVGLDLSEHRFTLVAGPPGSGRSTTLTTLASSLHAAGVPLLTICPAPSPLAHGPWPTMRPERPEHPDDVVGQARGSRVVLVDDVERLLGSPLESALAALVDDPGGSLVVAGATAALQGAFRGLVPLARTHRTGVLLRPSSPADGELLGVRALLDDAAPVGRGVLVVGGRQTIVQVASAAPVPRDAPQQTRQQAPQENRRRAVGAPTYG